MMERPIKSKYLKGVSQIEYHTELNKYYDALEEYAEQLQQEIESLRIALLWVYKNNSEKNLN